VTAAAPSAHASPLSGNGSRLESLWGFTRVVAARTVRGYLDVRGYDLAASLAYASLISFVPLVACVTVLSSTLFSDPGNGILRLIRLVVPGLTRELVADIQQLATQARAVSGWAAFFFLFTSLRMYFLLESAANALWGTTMQRRPLKRLGVAIGFVVLGPVAAGLGTSLLIESGAKLSEFHFSGLIVTCAILTLLYWAIPVAHVRWGPASAAGILVGTAIAFIKYELTKGVAALSGISRVYGSISAVVILVLALGVVWTLLLAGVSFAHALQFRCELLAHDEPEREARRGGPLDEAVRMLSLLADAWHSGRWVPLSVLSDEVRRPEPDVAARLKQLASAGLLRASRGDGPAANEDALTTSGGVGRPLLYRLARSPEEISLYTVARALGESVPRAVPIGDDPTALILRGIYRRADREVRSVLQGTSLRDVARPRREPKRRPAT
jgi:YihY family inner membrane protein